jgi:AcrR family transcriptional regulator
MARTDTTRSMRADARENRARLLRVAGEQFAASGSDVALETIAKAAGVGIGTLYRNFPTRDALVQATYRNEVERLCESADGLLAGAAPDQALADWMGLFVQYAATKRGLAAALMSIAASDAELFGATRVALIAAVGRFLEAGRESGSIRSDVDAEDVLRSMYAIWAIPEGPDWAAQSQRVLRLLIDGLRHGATRER